LEVKSIHKLAYGSGSSPESMRGSKKIIRRDGRYREMHLGVFHMHSSYGSVMLS
jgi:hypothetical protein